MPEVQLFVGGKCYEGWLSMRLTRSIEQAAAAFTLSFSERWSSERRPVPIDEGDACTVKVRGKLAVTGYIDDSNITYSATEHTMDVRGRSKAGDLVDCSAVHDSGQWANKGLLQIAKDLCDPYGVSVFADADVSKPLPQFALEQGEKVFDALERGARMYGCLLTSGSDGSLHFAEAGSKRTSTVLRLGSNIERGSRRGSWSGRFSKYIVKAQSRGSDQFSGADAATPQATATDPAVSRSRTLIVLADDQGAGDVLQNRATWERNVRAGRARKLTYIVRGWERQGGLWEPNLLVKVEDEILRVDAELLVVSATLILDGQGARTQLELTEREAYTVLELPPKTTSFIGESA